MPFFTGIGDPVTGAPAASTSGPLANPASGQLRLQPDQLDGAIAVFTRALETIEHEVLRARGEINAQAPAQDDVSSNVAAAFNQASLNAVSAWEGAVQQLRSIIEQLQAAKQAHLAADGNSASFLRPPG